MSFGAKRSRQSGCYENDVEGLEPEVRGGRYFGPI